MSTLRANTLSDASGANSVPMATVASGTAKAWVNFNGTGTVEIRAAFNVSSITDNGTGDYTVNFTNAMPDANYGVGFGNGAGTDDGDRSIAISTGTGSLKQGSTATLMSSTQLRINSRGKDFSQVHVSIFR